MTGRKFTAQNLAAAVLAGLVLSVPIQSAWADYSQQTGPSNIGVSPGNQLAQTIPNEPPVDVNSSGFRLTVCDGPKLPNQAMTDAQTKLLNHTYVPCDFNGVMLQVQHLINIAIVVGVLLAIVGMSYAGGLYITGSKANIEKAKDIFPKLFWGFIMMLTAWFIVYQILSWLTGNSGFAKLIGGN